MYYMPVKQQFILAGNVNDLFSSSLGDEPSYPQPLGALLWGVLSSEYRCSALLRFDPLYGFKLEDGDPEVIKAVTSLAVDSQKFVPALLPKAYEIIDAVAHSNKSRVGILINFASRLPDLAQQDINDFYYRLYRLSTDAYPIKLADEVNGAFSPIFWVLNKENDLPPWFSLGNPRVHSLQIPLPDNEVRREVLEGLLTVLPPFNEQLSALGEDDRFKLIRSLVDQTARMQAREIEAIVSIARRTENPEIRNLEKNCNSYKLGVVDNPWTKLDMDKVKHADTHLKQRVKGQDQAIQSASDIIKRSMFNLSGAQFSSNSKKPKGILFFAGPTGVGKTELAKAITELLFGSETNYIRFDMSEYSSEHADQRLVGSPPGYVGYDVGGQLTNAIKQNPFSIVLFDEIEKAHPKILDSFLQILDDGRITSGRGETVYFSESLIVFTSNLGVYEVLPDGTKRQRVSEKMPYSEVSDEITGAIEDFFTYKIGRPEILNRIGKNIIVFDFIRKEPAAEILQVMLKRIVQRLKEENGIVLDISVPVLDQIKDHCFSDLSMGGRGIGNSLEQMLINPLSRALFDKDAKSGQTLELSALTREEDSWTAILK